MGGLELRSFEGEVEIRATDGGGAKLVGVAPPWDTLSVDLGGFRERFLPGSVADMTDVVATFEHNDLALLGRTPKTLRLRETDRGLEYEVDLPDTENARALRQFVERGDVRGSSFEFFVMPGGQSMEEHDGGEIVRTITKARLRQVGPVLRPAYQQTDVAMRSVQEWRAERAKGVPADVLRRRLDLYATLR